jgi:hypothetical protein
MKVFKRKDILPQIPGLLTRGRFDFEFELLPYRVQGIGFRKADNLFVAGLNQSLLPARPLGCFIIEFPA